MALDRLLNSKDIREFIPISARGLYNLEKRGEFPKRIKVGSRCFWRESDIAEWMAEHI